MQAVKKIIKKKKTRKNDDTNDTNIKMCSTIYGAQKTRELNALVLTRGSD